MVFGCGGVQSVLRNADGSWLNCVWSPKSKYKASKMQVFPVLFAPANKLMVFKGEISKPVKIRKFSSFNEVIIGVPQPATCRSRNPAQF